MMNFASTEEQTIRYAIEGNMVHIYQNGSYIDSKNEPIKSEHVNLNLSINNYNLTFDYKLIHYFVDHRIL